MDLDLSLCFPTLECILGRQHFEAFNILPKFAMKVQRNKSKQYVFLLLSLLAASKIKKIKPAWFTNKSCKSVFELNRSKRLTNSRVMNLRPSNQSFTEFFWSGYWIKIEHTEPRVSKNYTSDLKQTSFFNLIDLLTK